MHSSLAARCRIVVAVIGLSTATCATADVIRPPCSALDRDDCWTMPTNAALHCDADARIAQALTDLGTFTHEQTCRPGDHLLLGPGTEEATKHEQERFVEENLIYAKALPGVRGTSPVCCSPNNLPGGCLVLYVDRCVGPTLATVARHATRWAKGLDLAHKRLRVVVRVGGTSPRCRPDDPTCAPVPYDRAEYEPGANRVPIRQRYEPPLDWLPPDAQPCEHDGDCTMACHDCASWVEPHGDMCSQEYRGQLREALCGCVAGHCSWFSQ